MEENSFILISGATSGIGQNIAENLSLKHNLILHGRNREKLENTLASCSTLHKHLVWEYDLIDVDNMEKSLSEFISANNIKVSVFIHCASILKMLPLRAFSLNDIKASVNINLISSIVIIKTLISKKFNGANLSNIVFISSTASILGAKAFNIYSATKGGMDSMMRSLAVELAPAVRINSILPGGIRTGMTEKIYQNTELIQKMEKEYPLWPGEAKDIFEMVDFLISEKSKWITGQQFVVDGGRSINISG